MTTRPLPRSLAGALASAVALSAVAACGGPGPVRAEPPAPRAGAASAACDALGAALPGDLDGDGRRATSPASPYTAAWGDSPVVLRCGVPRPAVLDNADPAARETSAVGVNGLSWAYDPSAKGTTFTLLCRAAYVEVFVPKRFGQPTAPLVDLAGAVRAAVPSTMDESEC